MRLEGRGVCMCSPRTIVPGKKFDRVGSAVLGDNELVAVILGYGYHRESSLDIAH